MSYIEAQVTINNAEQFSVGSIKGELISPPAGNTIRDLVKWYKESGGTWAFEPLEEKWYAVSDADGDIHVASIYLSDEDGMYVPALVGTEADGTDASRLLMLEFAPENRHELTSVYYMNTDEGPVQVEPKSITREITVMPIIMVRQMFGSDYYIPISHSPFTISAGNADSIRLDYLDIDKIHDIGDINGDGRAFDSSIAIKDIYDYRVDVSDRIQIKRAEIEPGKYTGKELGPKVVYHGEKLRAGVDYLWVKESVWNPETDTIEVPAFVEMGDYKVTLYGKGRFKGKKIEATFSIVKGINTLKVKPKTASVKYSKLKKKSKKLDVSKVIRFVNKGQGKMTYAKLSGNKKIAINEKTGKVTVKKGMKKGTYKVSVKVRAAGNDRFDASAWKIVKFRIKVK